MSDRDELARIIADGLEYTDSIAGSTTYSQHLDIVSINGTFDMLGVADTILDAGWRKPQVDEALTGYEGAIEGLSTTIGEHRAQLESVRDYARSLRDLANTTRDAGGAYLAHVYAEIAATLERKIGDQS